MCFVFFYFCVSVSTLVLLFDASQEKQIYKSLPMKHCQLRYNSYLPAGINHNVCLCANNEFSRKSTIQKLDTTLSRIQNLIPYLKREDVSTIMNSKLEHNLKTNKPVSNTEIETINNRKRKIGTDSKRNLFSLLVSKREQTNNNKLNAFYKSLEQFERNFYWTTFTKLATMGSKGRQENGVSFVQSGLFLCMALLALSTELDDMTKNEIKKAVEYHLNETDITDLLREVTSLLPISSNTLKFRWVTRLVLKDGINIDRRINGPAEAMKLNIRSVDIMETFNLTTVLNNMVANDSGGAMQNTFEEDELTNGICAVLLNTIYLRPRWRSPPTVLNGTSIFHDADTLTRSTRMIRINEVMLYADLHNWDAEAIEIEYGTPHLTLLLLVPRGHSLRRLASYMSNSSLAEMTRTMKTSRVAVTIPLYTLRMTLLLPNKLEEMGITKLFIQKNINATECEKLTLSHAVQSIMFWSEAGRNAFKDDGIEWDETPEKEIIVNRPYLFYVRWKNVTLLNGNFVL